LVTWLKTVADLPKLLSRYISGLPIVRNGTVSVYPIEFNAFASAFLFAKKIGKFFALTAEKNKNLLYQ
jgi:hypothetical protein